MRTPPQHWNFVYSGARGFNGSAVRFPTGLSLPFPPLFLKKNPKKSCCIKWTLLPYFGNAISRCCSPILGAEETCSSRAPDQENISWQDCDYHGYRMPAYLFSDYAMRLMIVLEVFKLTDQLLFGHPFLSPFPLWPGLVELCSDRNQTHFLITERK